MRNLRTLVWAYFVLLMIEGALRKWVVPALDAPLLIIRDPLTLWIYYEAYRNRLSFLNNAFFMPNLILGVVTVLLATFFGKGTPAITFFGFQAFFLQIPLIFIIPQIFNRDDVILVGKAIFYIAIPMSALVIYQFRSPTDSWINKGAFVTWYDTVRPSGTFSYISGPVVFFPMTAAFIFYGFLNPRTYPSWLLIAVTFAVLLAGSCSGSRSILVATGIVIAVTVLCVIIQGKGMGNLVGAAVVLCLLVPLLSTLSVVQDGTKQLTQRFSDAARGGEDAQGFADRYANTMLGPIMAMADTPLLGNGLGMGTNAAASLLTGRRQFLGSEDEWGRLILECGPLFGFLLIVIRIGIVLTLLKSSYDALRRDNMLPMLILAAVGTTVLNGQWGVPTSLGFAIFGAGLTLAACVEPEEEEYDDEQDGQDEHGEPENEHDHDEHADDEPDHSPATDQVT